MGLSDQGPLFRLGTGDVVCKNMESQAGPGGLFCKDSALFSGPSDDKLKKSWQKVLFSHPDAREPAKLTLTDTGMLTRVNEASPRILQQVCSFHEGCQLPTRQEHRRSPSM